MTGIPENMTTYVLVFLKKGPAWTAERSPALDALQEAHLAYLGRLQQDGVLVLNGPLLDDGEIRGVSVYKTGTPADAVALASEDPGVRAGRFVIEAHPWMTHKGILP